MAAHDKDGGGSSAPPRRILIVLMGAIGDVVRALPLLGRLRRAWPKAHIAWAVEPKSAPILQDHPWLDEVVVYERRRAPWSFPPFLLSLRRGGFDLVLDLQRHLKSGFASMVTMAPDRWGFAPLNSKEFNHRFSNHHIEPQPNLRLKLLQYQAFGDALGLGPAPIEFGLRPSDAEVDRVNKLLAGTRSPMMAAILGSSWPSRIYFPEAVAEVIRTMARERGLSPILIGGPGEQGIAAQVIHHLGEVEALNLVGRTTLRDLIAIFPRCVLAFAPDCGPMHIAAAVGCPVVSLWGSTAPERSAPWGFEEFALSGEIPCHPCYLRRCPIGRECMRRIAPAAVVEALARALARGQSGAAAGPAAALAPGESR